MYLVFSRLHLKFNNTYQKHQKMLATCSCFITLVLIWFVLFTNRGGSCIDCQRLKYVCFDFETDTRPVSSYRIVRIIFKHYANVSRQCQCERDLNMMNWEPSISVAFNGCQTCTVIISSQFFHCSARERRNVISIQTMSGGPSWCLHLLNKPWSGVPPILGRPNFWINQCIVNLHSCSWPQKNQ